MSKYKFLLRKNNSSWITKGIDVQHFLCDKGGGLKIIRNISVINDPCDTEEFDCNLKMDLKCKVALVTGGASGIGYAIANELLKEKLYRVVIGDIDPCSGMRAAHKLNELYGENKCCYYALNAACVKQMGDVMNKVKENYGRLDVLINNAAILSSNVDLEIDTNYRPIIHSTNMALPMMSSQNNPGGLVINIGDVKGISGCKFFPVYASEKAGVHTFSMGMGKESEKKHKVRIISVVPGLTDTEMGRHFIDKPEPAKNMQRASIVGKAVIYVAKYGDSGKLYVIDKRKLSIVIWPCKEAIMDLIESV